SALPARTRILLQDGRAAPPDRGDFPNGQIRCDSRTSAHVPQPYASRSTRSWRRAKQPQVSRSLDREFILCNPGDFALKQNGRWEAVIKVRCSQFTHAMPV